MGYTGDKLQTPGDGLLRSSSGGLSSVVLQSQCICQKVTAYLFTEGASAD